MVIILESIQVRILRSYGIIKCELYIDFQISYDTMEAWLGISRNRYLITALLSQLAHRR